jgi:hypothetical protein
LSGKKQHKQRNKNTKTQYKTGQIHRCQCAVVVVEDFDAVEVCCETVVACVEPEVCDCLLSWFILNII